MAMILRSSRLRLTQAIFFGEPGTAGSVTQITEGYGITATPNPINSIGTIALSSPLPSDWAAGNVNINSRNSTNWFNVMAYGADPSGVANSTPSIQAAITDAEAVGGTVYFPHGTYKCLAPPPPLSPCFVVTAQVTFRGDSAKGSLILLPNVSDGFVITTITNTQRGVSFYDLEFQANGVATAGALVRSNATGNFPLYVRNCTFVAHFIGLQMNSNWASVISDCQFLSGVVGNTDILIDNLINDDQGDNQIEGNTFWSNGAYNIRQRAGGGTRILSNKFLGAAGYSVLLDLQVGKITSDLLIHGNSFEGNPVNGSIGIAPDGTYQLTLIETNQFLGIATAPVIDIAPSATGFALKGRIANNSFWNGANCVRFNPGQASGANAWYVGGNQFNIPTTAAIQLPATPSRVANLEIGLNQYVQTGVVPYIAGDLSTTSRQVPGVRSLFVQTANKTTTANVATSIVGTGVGSMTIEAGRLMIGSRIILLASGFNAVADGGAAGKVGILSLAGVNMAGITTGPFANVVVSGYWTLRAEITIQTTGVGGTAFGVFDMRWPNQGFNLAGAVTAAAAVDTTAANLVDFTYNNGSVTGTITTTGLSMEILNG